MLHGLNWGTWRLDSLVEKFFRTHLGQEALQLFFFSVFFIFIFYFLFSMFRSCPAGRVERLYTVDKFKRMLNNL
jgi:hypothetical protein